jgi:hypothetical protein
MANQTPSKDDAAIGSAPSSLPPVMSPLSPTFEAPWNKMIESDDEIVDVGGGTRAEFYV